MMEMTALNRRCILFALAFFVSTALIWTPVAHLWARPFRIAKTPDKGRNFGCATCHVDSRGGGKRNPFGRHYEKVGLAAGDKYVDSLGGLDSDGDGFTNDQEFAAGTHPGEAKSKPTGKSGKE
ncbi:MAG: thrombospondin type 3 repeat-containing protein [Thermodesulfobacteriota bacterium]|nr:thrombospondin type 3 repeat-containing protein [Thermodesulfobacteriota bacterium]